MPSELRENAEARMMPAAGAEAGRLLPSREDMAAFWAKMAIAGSAAQREQQMFADGFSFQGVQELYGVGGRGTGADNYLTAGGIIGAVGLKGSAPMSEVKAKEGDRQAGQQPVEKPVLNTPEGQQVRNAPGEHVEAIKAANPNASDGSVKNWVQMTQAEKFAHADQEGQCESFTLVEKNSGKDEVVAARQYAAGVVLKAQEPVMDLSQVDNRPIKDYQYQVTAHENGKVKAIETGVAYEVGKPQVTEQGLFERIGALPLDQQAQVIGAGIKAFSGEMTHQQFRIGVGAITGLGDGVVGLAQGAENLGKAVLGVAQFSRDVMANDPATVDTAGKGGESLGKLLVGGVRVFSAAEGYLEAVGAATNVGDYGKPLRDVAWLGQQMNSRWEAMSPEEKTRVVTKLAVENLGAFAAGGVINKVAKSMDVAGALEELGQTAKTFGAGQREKYSKLISEMSQELMPQKGLTTNGFEMPIPKTDGNMLMSKADDLGGSGRLVGKGVDATGKSLKFSDESGIKLNHTRPGQDDLWQQVPVLRGNDVHVGLGENLPSNTKTIDRIHVKDGIATSIKSIEPRDASYQQPGAFESKLRGYIHELETYKGRQTKAGHGLQLQERRIQEKKLHIGIPDGALSDSQKNVLEKLGKQVMNYNATRPLDKAPIKLEVTVLQ